MSAKSGSVQKLVRELVGQSVWLQLTRRTFPHQASSSRFTERVLNITNAGGSSTTLKYVMEYSFDGAVAAEQEDKATSGVTEAKAGSKQAEDELSRMGILKDLWSRGMQIHLRDLKVKDDLRQMCYASAKPTVPLAAAYL